MIHLAWLIQPSRDEAAMRATNVEGSLRVFRAAGAAGVGAVVHASSVGVDTPPLARRTGGPLRIRELLTGIGGRSG